MIVCRGTCNMNGLLLYTYVFLTLHLCNDWLSQPPKGPTWWQCMPCIYFLYRRGWTACWSAQRPLAARAWKPLRGGMTTSCTGVCATALSRGNSQTSSMLLHCFHTVLMLPGFTRNIYVYRLSEGYPNLIEHGFLLHMTRVHNCNDDGPPWCEVSN